MLQSRSRGAATKQRAIGSLLSASTVATRHAGGSATTEDFQRIFAAGILLTVATEGCSPAATASIEQAIAELDSTLLDIRAAVLVDTTGDPQREGRLASS